MVLTSDLWPTSLFTNSLATRRSCWRILRSLLPDANMREFHAKTPVLVWCPPMVLTFLHWLPSHIWKRRTDELLSWNMTSNSNIYLLLCYLNLTQICSNRYVGTLFGPLNWAHTIIGSQITKLSDLKMKQTHPVDENRLTKTRTGVVDLWSELTLQLDALHK